MIMTVEITLSAADRKLTLCAPRGGGGSSEILDRGAWSHFEKLTHAYGKMLCISNFHFELMQLNNRKHQQAGQ